MGTLRGPVQKRMRKAYRADSALEAEAQLTELAQELDMRRLLHGAG